MNASWDGSAPGVAGGRCRGRDAGATQRRQACALRLVGGLIVSIRGVLYDDSGWRRWLLQLISRMGLHTHYASFFRLWERDYLSVAPSGLCEYWGALRKYLMSAGMSPGQIDEVIAAGHVRRRRFEEDIRPFPGVKATLAQLAARGVPLAAVSSPRWSGDETAQQLRKLDVQDRFQTAIAGPDPIATPISFASLLRSAHSAMRLPASHTALVSCSTLELTAAAALGLQTVAFNCEADAEAGVYIEQFDQLLDVLDCRSIRSLAG